MMNPKTIFYRASGTRRSHVPHRHARGMALVIVLAMLVLITGLVVAFFSSVTSDADSSAVYSNDAKAKQLADSSVNLVMGQIIEATKGFKAGSTADAARLAWASQPGAVRTFDTDGLAYQTFKLYSAQSMVESGSGNLTADVPATWAADTGSFTDLNAPVLDANGNAVYPIMDPSAQGSVEGFSITAAPTANTTNTAPMPVRWIYMLKDGTLTAPSGGAGTAATWAGAAANLTPSTTNPIVGRIAFWTDDETCKVNINTASEGTYWDVPRVSGVSDVNYAKFQPAQREFQRYPGHPAMTSLAPVFFATSNSITPAQRDALYGVAPRIMGGGSNGGTAKATAAITPDSDRLYASVDELGFKVPTVSGTRSVQDAGSGITANSVRQRAFFLTASSRAPETTLFGKPRIALWPLDATTADTHRTAFDRLIAFCSTVGAAPNTAYPFYFTRSDPKSATADYSNSPRNRQLYEYLKTWTGREIPGFGGNFDSKWQTDRDQVLTEIFDFIRATNLNDSGLATANRFGKRGEITYSASTRTPGSSQVTPIRIGTTQGFGRFPTISEVGIHFICSARTDDPATASTDESAGSNVAANKTLGGTLLTGTQRRIEAMFFYETFIPSMSNPPMYDAYAVRIAGLDGFQVQVNGNGTSLGFPSDATDLSFLSRTSSVNGRDYGGTFSQRAVLQGYPTDANKCSRLPARGVLAADAGATAVNAYPFVGIPVTIDAAAGTMTFTGGSITLEIYPRTLDTAPGYPSGTQPVQTLTMTFEGGTFPIPDLVTVGTPQVPSGSAFALTTDKENWWTFSRDGAMPGKAGRINAWSFFPKRANSAAATAGAEALSGDPFHPNDVVRAMVPAQNDYRFLGLNLPPGTGPTAFVKHPSFDTTAVRLAHAVSENMYADTLLGRAVQGTGFLGSASGATYNSRCAPDVPVPMPAGLLGDWDNGISYFPDGPYINRADEGNIYIGTATDVPYFDNSQAYTEVGQTFFSPNRQIPSAGMLGSLPSQPKAGKGFQTLLFRPQPGHPGAANPPDHLITDYFWMPVVEPYAISEPFSTAGKINLNCAVAPFGYIKRQTGLHALLRSEMILSIPSANGNNYKLFQAGTTIAASGVDFRKTIDRTETLKQWDAKFARNELFVSPSQICELHLIPTGTTINLTGNTTDADSKMPAFWTTNGLTGDNSRERPYANLLGRLTTKSNSFTVHFRVQALKKNASAAANQWVEGKDVVLSEYRGATLIERYVDPNDPNLPDFATETDPQKSNIDQYYRFRVVQSRKFAP